MRADPVVAALDGADVFKHHIAAVAVNVEPIVVWMRRREVADYKVRVVAAHLHARAAHGCETFNIRQRLPRGELQEKCAVDLLRRRLLARRGLHKRPLARL